MVLPLEFRVDLCERMVVVLNESEPAVDLRQKVVGALTATPALPYPACRIGKALIVERTLGMPHPLFIYRPVNHGWILLMLASEPAVRSSCSF